MTQPHPTRNGSLAVPAAVAAVVIVLAFRPGAFEHLAPISLWIAMLASLYSGVEYYIRFAPKVLRDSSSKEGARPS